MRSTAEPMARRLHMALIVAARRLVPLVLLMLWAPQALAQVTQTRETEYEYDPASGQVTLERVDPGGSHCVETRYEIDATYGHRKSVEVKPCDHISNSSSAYFAPRKTINEFAAGTNHPANAYVTRTRSGNSSISFSTTWTATNQFTESRATFDANWGLPASATEVAPQDSKFSSTTSTVYDAFGRALRQTSPSKKDSTGTVLAEVSETVSRHYCLGSKAPSPKPAACLSLTESLLGTLSGVQYPSKRLAYGTDAPASTVNIPLRVESAYYIETVPIQGITGSNAIGATSRVHYDRLHREVAKETQVYGGGWSRTLTAYDALGQVAASWGAHFTTANATALTQVRQSTSARDVLHRPVETQHPFRASASSSVETLTARVQYEGLTTTQIIPVASLLGVSTVDRTRKTVKNGAGQVAMTVDPLGATVTMAYDPFGNLVQATDALGNNTTVSYTAVTGRFKTGMSDPDKGSWIYTYDALGQLKSQTDARGKVTQLTYDVLGRMTAKSTPDLAITWSHGTYATAGGAGVVAGAACAGGLPRQCETRSGAGAEVYAGAHHVYDTLGRGFETRQLVDRTYTSSVTFDDAGRVDVKTYPTGFGVKHLYTASGSSAPGVLRTIHDKNNAARKFWTLDGVSQPFDANGKLLRAMLGNDAALNNFYDPSSGKALTLAADIGGGTRNLFHHEYTYDRAGNLEKRDDKLTAVVESFAYDALDRLLNYEVDRGSQEKVHQVAVRYNAIGNILSKTDVGNYNYSTTDANGGPHAVTSAGGTNYTYDANGNVLSSTGLHQRTHTWTDFNRPKSLSYGSRKVEFWYDDQFKRVKEVVTVAGGTGRVVIQLHPDAAGGLAYEREETWSGTPGSSTMTRNENRHYIAVPGAMALVKTYNANTVNATLVGTVTSNAADLVYWHYDLLGSVVAVSNSAGVLERSAFDAWGRRLRDSGLPDAPFAGPQHGDRGFTGHEHLDELGLIHMNGRVYDPTLGRFFSADPFVQSPGDLQSYNAYSYVLNNPLRYTDPSGQIWWHVAAFVAGLVMAHEGNEYWGMVGRIMMMWALSSPEGLVETGLGVAAENATSCLAPNMFSSGMVGNAMASAAIATAASPGASGDDIVSSALFAAAFNGVGGFKHFEQRLIGHMVLGCAQAAMSGGKCGPGAMAAAVAKGVSEKMPGNFNELQRGVITAIAGGTASVIGGGKFANGAANAAFGYLFNCLAHGCSMKSEGYEPTFYREDGILCNGPSDPACRFPGANAPAGNWKLGYSQDDKISVRVGGFAVDYSLLTNEPTFGGLQAGGVGYKYAQQHSFGWTSGEVAPMAKFSLATGLLTGVEVSLGIGFNGIKVSASGIFGTVGRVTGPFPRQEVQYGNTTGIAIGLGRQ